MGQWKTKLDEDGSMQLWNKCNKRWFKHQWQTKMYITSEDTFKEEMTAKSENP